MNKPKVNSESQKQLDAVEKQFEQFNEQVQSMTLDSMNKAPVVEREQQTKMSNREMNKTDAPYIKPVRSISSKEPFNEKYRKEWEESWEYVKCVVENLEIIGERVEKWTKRFAGDPAHFWQIPVNKPIYLPRFVADELSKCCYHRLKMDENIQRGSDGTSTLYGTMVVDQKLHRLNCRPVDASFASMAI
jgi:hypothetical protein